MSRFRVGLAIVAMTAVGVFVFAGGGGAASAAPIPGGSIEVVCAGALNGTTYTLSANCGDVTDPITVPSTITTVNGAGHTISATDIGSSEFDGAILTNASSGQTMNIENLTVSGPAGGFQVCTNSNDTLFGIRFNDASGSVDNVTVEHIWQQPNLSDAPSCNAGTAIRADNPSAPRTVTITRTTVMDYQKNGIDGRGAGMTMDVSDSTIGPPNDQEGLIAANGLVYVGSTGTAMNNTIFGSGDQQLPGPPGGGTDATAVILFGAQNVTITHNMITGAKTDVGVSVSSASTGNIISFNTITRTAPDVPDPTGHGIDVFTPDGSSATPICNTFSKWNTNIVGAEQISCAPLPKGTECQSYSAAAPAVDSGKNYEKTDPFPIIDATPFTWTVDSGKLPAGLSLSSGGAITGTPTEAGTFKFTMKVADSTGLTATQAQTITIASGGCATIDKTADSRTVMAGGMAGYQITVTNGSRHTARNLWICDRIPRHMTFVRATRRLRVFRRMRCLVIARLLPHHRTRFHVTLHVASNAPNGAETNTGEVIPGGGVTPGSPGKPPTVTEPVAKAKPIAKAKAKVRVRHRHRHPARPPRVTG
jgi:uncharacterized repeat protein (TIGR01451 family)